MTLSDKEFNMRLLIAAILFFSSFTISAQSNLDFKVETLKNERIEIKTLHQNGPLLISFWALWCQPCKAEMIHLKNLFDDYKEEGFTILGINQDSPKSVSKVRAYVASKGIEFPIVLDTNFEIFNRLNGQVLPYALLINRKGEIVFRQTGYVPGDEKILEEEILKLLSGHDENP